MSLLTSLLVLIAAARVFGRVFERAGQPAIVGEMLAGVLLGPSVLGLVHASAAFSGISELAVLLVVLSAGLEMTFKDVADALRGRGIVIAVLGFFVPLGAGILTGHAFGLDGMRTAFLGLCVSITALPVAVRILQEFDLLDSDIARYSVATAVFNDVFALLAVGVMLSLPAEGALGSLKAGLFGTLGVSCLKLVALLVLVLGIDRILRRLIERGFRVDAGLKTGARGEALFGGLALFVLGFGAAAELLGFHFVIGAFFGALLVDRRLFSDGAYRELEGTLRSVTGGLLAPVFFAYLGLKLDFSAMGSFAFVATVLVVSLVSKVLAGWLGGRLIGLSGETSLGIGIVLNARGVMELVVASIAYDRGLIGQGLFSALVLMGVATTLLTPTMLRAWVRIPGRAEQAKAEPVMDLG